MRRCPRRKAARFVGADLPRVRVRREVGAVKLSDYRRIWLRAVAGVTGEENPLTRRVRRALFRALLGMQ